MRRRRKGGFNPIGGCLIIIAGLMLMGGVYVVHLFQQDFARTAQTATGTVIEMVKGSGKNNSHFPVVQFITPRENVYSFQSSMGSNPPAYQVGQQVEILYNPEAPEQAVIAADNSITTNYMMWLFAGVGAVLVLLGVYPLAKLVKQLRERVWSSPDAVSAL